MAWSVIVENLQDYPGFSEQIIETLVTAHVSYPFDADLALKLAKDAGLASATLAGGRTPNPYGGDEVVDISIHGFASSRGLVDLMKLIVVQPEDRDE